VFPLKIKNLEEENNSIYIDKNFGLLFGHDLAVKFNQGRYINTLAIGDDY
jgi:hypothetical protein